MNEVREATVLEALMLVIERVWVARPEMYRIRPRGIHSSCRPFDDFVGSLCSLQSGEGE